MDRRLSYALGLAAQGAKIFPTRQDKVPCIKEWNKGSASSDEGQIRQWLKSFLSCNFAMYAGGSPFVVLDVDTKNNEPGLASLE